MEVGQWQLSPGDADAVEQFLRDGYAVLETPVLPRRWLRHFDRAQRSVAEEWRRRQGAGRLVHLDQPGGQLTPHPGQRAFAVMFLEVLRRAYYEPTAAAAHDGSDGGSGGAGAGGSAGDYDDVGDGDIGGGGGGGAGSDDPLALLEAPRVLEMARRALGLADVSELVLDQISFGDPFAWLPAGRQVRAQRNRQRPHARPVPRKTDAPPGFAGGALTRNAPVLLAAAQRRWHRRGCRRRGSAAAVGLVQRRHPQARWAVPPG